MSEGTWRSLALRPCRFCAEKDAEIARLCEENANLRAYVGDEMLRSDFRTAGDMRAELERLREENAQLKAPKLFPIQRGPHVPWEEAEKAYVTYARLFGSGQSLARLAERGGFGVQEFLCLWLGHEPGCGTSHSWPNWENSKLREENAALRTELLNWKTLEATQDGKRQLAEAQVQTSVVQVNRHRSEAQQYADLAFQRGLERERAEAQVKTLRETLAAAPCKCSTTPIPICLSCGGELRRVVYCGGPLNEDQWMSIRAGDWYCTACTSNKSGSGYEYFWDREIRHRKDTCQRCAALAVTEEPHAQ